MYANRYSRVRRVQRRIRRFRLYAACASIRKHRLSCNDLLLYRRQKKKLKKLLTCRYLNRRSSYRKFRKQSRRRAEMFLRSGVGSFLNEEEFKNEYGMSRTSFDRLYNLIKDHRVFRNDRTQGVKQTPIKHQLLVLLSFLRTEGNGKSNRRGRTTFDMGSGTQSLCWHRCVVAVCDTLGDQIDWPEEEERDAIAARIKRDHKLPNCVGVADGTILPLAFKPETEDAADYFCRKRCYALTMLVINDDNRRIRYIHVGWPGCTHDDRVFRNSHIAVGHRHYFSPAQYLLGDSAYSCQDFMVSAYKKSANRELDRGQEIFNKTLSSPRVESEHAIGMLKGRWPFLRSIRMRIRKDNPKACLKRIFYYIRCCVILHNLLLDDEIDEFDDDDVSVIDADNVLNRPQPVGMNKDFRREELKNYILEKYH